MARGANANIGDERQAQNGYWYVKQASGWKLKHHIVAEQKLGRKLRSNERVYFKDKDKQNFDSDNIEVRVTRNSKADRKKAIKDKIEMLKQQLKDLEAEDE